MNADDLFTKTHPLKLFLYVAVPGVIAMVASTIYQVIDGVLVGQFLGEAAFAALALAMPFAVINFSIADLIGVGSAVPMSIALGEGKQKEANNIFTCAILMIVGTGFFMGALLYFSAPTLFTVMGADAEVASLAVSYLQVFAILSPVTTLTFAIDNFLKVCGKVKLSMGLNILGAGIGIILSILFLGFLKWGIAAAALAFCISMIVATVIGIIPLLLGKYLVKPCIPHFHLSMMKTILSCGTPNFLNNVSGRVIEIIMNILLLRFGGTTAVSVYAIVMYADSFFFPFLYGMCDALQPSVGYNWGAGNTERVRSLEKCIFTAACIISILCAALVILFPTQITLLFISNVSPEFLAMAEIALRLFALSYLVKWFTFAVQSFLLAIGQAKPASILSICSTLVFPLLMVIVLLPLELTGVWMNFACSAVLGAVLAGIILARLCG